MGCRIPSGAPGYIRFATGGSGRNCGCDSGLCFGGRACAHCQAAHSEFSGLRLLFTGFGDGINVNYDFYLRVFKEKNLKITKILPIENLDMNSKLFDDYSKNCNNLGMKEIMLALNVSHASEGGLFTIIAKK